MPTTNPHRSPAIFRRSPGYAAEGRVRMRARNMALASGARLLRAAARAGGDDGLALACALIDMILSGMPPTGWPIMPLVALLETEIPARDRQVAGLLVALRKINADIDRLEDGDDGAPAGVMQPRQAA